MWQSVRGREECLKVARNPPVKKESVFVGKWSIRKKKRKKNPNFPIRFDSAFLCVQMFSYATFSARSIVLRRRNVGERALLYVQSHFTNKPYASKVVISQEGNSRPQLQTVPGQPSQPPAPIQIFFLRFLDYRIHANTSLFFHSAFPVQLLSALVCRAKAELYCLYVHLLNASGM